MIKRYQGLTAVKLPSGKVIYRVRPKGQHSKKIQIHGEPGSEEFDRAYWLARRGEKVKVELKPSQQQTPKSIGWLVESYFEYLDERAKAKTTSPKTIKKKRNLLNRLLARPNREMLIPREKLIEMQDKMAASPAQADAFIEAIRVMYDWAVDRGHLKANPALKIKKVYTKGNGAQPWKAADVRAFFAKHRPGTSAHVSMSVLLWTGCRVEDLTVLGRKHECQIEGLDAVRWQPSKKGSSEVCIPLLEPLRAATRAPTVQGQIYVLNRTGKPYASGDAMSAMFKRWCIDADLPHLSAHGVRKGLAELLAEMGCSQYEIMAILGHSEAKTSEVYTRRVERWNLARQALGKVDWKQ